MGKVYSTQNFIGDALVGIDVLIDYSELFSTEKDILAISGCTLCFREEGFTAYKKIDGLMY